MIRYFFCYIIIIIIIKKYPVNNDPSTHKHTFIYQRYSDSGRFWEQLASKQRYTCSTRRPIWYASGVNIDSFKVVAAMTTETWLLYPLSAPLYTICVQQINYSNGSLN